MVKELTRKFSPGKIHIVGAVIFFIGITLLTIGIVRIIKINNRTDVSVLTSDTIKSGMYVKGKISTVLCGDFKNSAFATDKKRPLAVIGEDGSDITAEKTGYITDLIKGKYCMIYIDSNYFPELYEYIDNGKFNDNLTEFEFDGIIEKNKNYEDYCDYVDGIYQNFPTIYDGKQNKITDLNRDNISEYCVEIIDIEKKKKLWLYSLPIILAGIITMLVGGMPFKYVEKK